MADRTPDEVIAKVQEIANLNPGPCEPMFSAACDQWWLVRVKCTHGQFDGHSQGMCDVSTAFLGAMSNYWRGHPDSAAEPGDAEKVASG